ncbi:MAG: spore coat U domain-containing protein [Geminicoccaceae bacterium]|nr:spore coat protein U domain-containing protein [Geminicoccaceae bacterium]HRY22833.1 spore coat U domain-containing protein [Geminicoccaceae bacterium]
MATRHHRRRHPCARAMAALALAASPVAAPNGAHAATATDQLTVTATVQSGCTLTGGTLDFGNYVSGQTSNLDANGRIGFANCSGLLTFELDGGQSGNVNNRAMRSSGNTLTYQIYRNSVRNAVWGQGQNALQLQLLQPQSGEAVVYGRIPGGQAVPGGAYVDIVNITLTF